MTQLSKANQPKTTMSDNDMKTIHFVPKLIPLIINGDKTVTWRVEDDKDIQVGDTLEFANAASRTAFGQAQVTKVEHKLIKDITDEDYEAGHERYDSPEEMIETFRDYYGDDVDEETEIKMVHYDFTLLK